jgi:hypothetical protein
MSSSPGATGERGSFNHQSHQQLKVMYSTNTASEVNRSRKFHRENPYVYILFEQYTFEAIRAGHRQYGAKSVCERLRWHTDMEITGDTFKISNNNTALYARLFHLLHPKFDGFFRIKARKSERNPEDRELVNARLQVLANNTASQIHT